MDAFSAPQFTNDEAARKFLAELRWPSGPVCPHCGVVGHAYQVTRLGKTGKIPAFGVYRCAEKVCRKDFSVTTGTVMERSHIALHKWLQGFYLMCSSKKGVSAHQIHRTLNVTYKAAWFMAHRIREAMKAGGLAPVGGEGKTVEMDETYMGRMTITARRKLDFDVKSVSIEDVRADLAKITKRRDEFNQIRKAISAALPTLPEMSQSELRPINETPAGQ